MPKHAPATGRRWQATLIIAIFMLAVAAAAAGGWWYARESPPHQGPILLISVDRLAADGPAAADAPRPAAPGLEALAADAVVFDHAFAHGLQVLPAHATLFTGQLPFQHGVRDDGGFVLQPGARTLAEVLKSRGFNTGAAVSSFLLRRETGIAQGFNFFDANLDERHEAPAIIERSGERTVDAAERWARLQASQRYFLMLQVGAADADMAVRRLTDLLRERQLYDDATILVVGDRAAATPENGLDETTLRVPLLVKQPDNEGAGRRVTDAVQQIDVLPTILDFVRAPIPSGVHGHSLRGILDSERAHLAPRPLYAEWLAPYFRFGGRPVYAGTPDSDQPIDGPSPIAPAEEDRLAMAAYLPGLFPPGAPAIDVNDAAQRAIVDVHRQAALRTPADLTPAAIDPPLALADALIHLGRPADAASYADTAVALAAEAPPARAAAAHVVATRIALARKDADGALAHASAAEKVDPSLPVQRFVRGRLLYDEGKFDEALGPFEDAAAAIRRSGGAIPGLQLYLGETLSRLERPADAESAFRDEMRAFPHQMEAYASLAMLYAATDRSDDVEDVLAALVESTPTPEGYAMAARLWTTLGERSRAEALRSDARTRFRGDPSLVLLGRDGRR